MVVAVVDEDVVVVLVSVVEVSVLVLEHPMSSVTAQQYICFSGDHPLSRTLR